MNYGFEDVRIAFRHYSNKELKLARLLFGAMQHSFITKAGIVLTKLLLSLHLPIKPIIRKTLFRQFCGGTSLVEAGETASLLKDHNVQVILDYGVESKELESEFDKTCENLVEAVRYASEHNIPFISIKVTGIARFGLLEKKHQGVKLNSIEELEWERVCKRMNRICTAVAQSSVMVLVDAEETWIQEPVNELTDAMMEKFNTNEAIVYNTYQLYCKGTVKFLETSVAAAIQKGYILGAKLVRGAYMEKERKRARKYGYPDPIQDNKKRTDEDFDRAIVFCLQHIEEVGLFIGTHNEKSCIKAISLMNKLGIARNHAHIYFSQLYGMSDNISFNLAHDGYRVAKYLPYGPVEDVIPYLMRRAEENTSVAGQTNRELSLIKKEIKRRNRAKRAI